MSRVPNAPPDDIFGINLKPLQAFLVDLPAGATKGMRHQQPGFEEACREIVTNQPGFGDRAGITATHFAQFQALNSQYGLIAAQLPIVSKANEVLTESLAHVDNLRHRLASTFATSVEAHAKTEGSASPLITAYEQTIAYRSSVADKGVKTRQKNAAAMGNGNGTTTASPEPGTGTNGAAPGSGGNPTAGGTAAGGSGATSSAAGATGAGTLGGTTAPVAVTAKGVHHVDRTPNPPPADIFTINLTPLKPYLVDLPAGAMRGMLREHEGWLAVVAEVTRNQPTLGDRAGITATDFNKFTTLNAQYAQILAVAPVVAKAEEVLIESLAQTDNHRHQIMTAFAKAAEAHANAEGGDPTLLTAYEQTIAYRGVIADKAAKTRKKNEAQSASGATGATGSAGGSGTGAPGAGARGGGAAGASGKTTS